MVHVSFAERWNSGMYPTFYITIGSFSTNLHGRAIAYGKPTDILQHPVVSSTTLPGTLPSDVNCRACTKARHHTEARHSTDRTRVIQVFKQLDDFDPYCEVRIGHEGHFSRPCGITLRFFDKNDCEGLLGSSHVQLKREDIEDVVKKLDIEWLEIKTNWTIHKFNKTQGRKLTYSSLISSGYGSNNTSIRYMYERRGFDTTKKSNNESNQRTAIQQYVTAVQESDNVHEKERETLEKDPTFAPDYHRWLTTTNKKTVTHNRLPFGLRVIPNAVDEKTESEWLQLKWTKDPKICQNFFTDAYEFGWMICHLGTENERHELDPLPAWSNDLFRMIFGENHDSKHDSKQQDMIKPPQNLVVTPNRSQMQRLYSFSQYHYNETVVILWLGNTDIDMGFVPDDAVQEFQSNASHSCFREGFHSIRLKPRTAVVLSDETRYKWSYFYERVETDNPNKQKQRSDSDSDCENHDEDGSIGYEIVWTSLSPGVLKRIENDKSKPKNSSSSTASDAIVVGS